MSSTAVQDVEAPKKEALDDAPLATSFVLSPPSTILTKPATSIVSSASVNLQSDAGHSSSNEATSVNSNLKSNIQTSEGLEAEENDGLEMKTLLHLIDNEIRNTPTAPPKPLILPPKAKAGTYAKTAKRNDRIDNNSNNVPHLHHLYENHSFKSQQAGDYCVAGGETTAKSRSHTESTTKITLSEILYVPVKKYPKYNFVGRILGPRGMTVKQLEKETGCKIFVRGRASNVAFNPHTKMMRGGVISNKSSLSTISQSALTDEPLHVYIECFNYPALATERMKYAVSIIKDLLSPPADGKDELKRQQLVDISLINGTYRPTIATANTFIRGRPVSSAHKNTVDPTSSSILTDKSSISISFSKSQHSVNENESGDAAASVYRIPQQKRSWHKPRGPDATTEEFAKSIASRELVSDIVTKNKQIPRVISIPHGNQDPNDEDEDQEPLSPSAISESLKIANTLLQSHDKMSFANPEDFSFPQQLPPQSIAVVPHAPHAFPFEFPMFPMHLPPPPPPPPMAFNNDFSQPPPPIPNHQNNHHFYLPPPNFCDPASGATFYPLPSFSVPSDPNSLYQFPGFVYMLPSGFNVFDNVMQRRQ